MCVSGTLMAFVEEREESPLFETDQRDVVQVFRCPVCHAVLVSTAPPKSDRS
jgi:hypothetical protein